MRWGKVSLALSFLVLSILLASCAGHDQPLGGMLHRYDNTFPASVHSLLRDVVSFNKNDEANIVIIPSNDVRVSLRIWGPEPSQKLLVDWTAEYPGQRRNFLWTAPEDGTYLFEVTVKEGRGKYRILVLPAATAEAERFGENPQDNGSIARAEDLSSRFYSMTGEEDPAAAKSSRAALFGELTGEDEDFYSVRVEAGQSIEAIAAGSESSQAPDLALYDERGNLLAQSTYDHANQQSRLLAGRVGEPVNLIFKVSGAADIPYSLVMLRNAVLEQSPNNSPERAMAIPDLAGRGILTGPISIYGAAGELVTRDLENPAGGVYNLHPFVIDFSPAATFGQPDGIGIAYNGTRFLQGMAGPDGSEGIETFQPLSMFSVKYTRSGSVELPFSPELSPQVFAGTHARAGSQQIISFHNELSEFYYGRLISWREGQGFIQVTNLFKNTFDTAITDLYFAESFDPAPGFDPTVTDPALLAQAVLTANDVIVDEAGVRAVAANDYGALVIGSADPRAAVTVLTGETLKSSVDPQNLYAARLDPNGAVSDDALHVAFKIDEIPVNQMAAVTYVIAFGSTAEEALANYSAAQPEGLISAPMDFYTLPLVEGQTAEITLRAPGGPVGNLYNPFDPALTLLDDSGAVVLYKDDSGGTYDPKIIFPVERTGNYMLRVEPALFNKAWQKGLTNGGEYVLTVWVHNPPAFLPIQPQSVRRGQELTFLAQAEDPDLPEDTLYYSILDGPQKGALAIDPTSGEIRWQVPADHPLGWVELTLQVSDATHTGALSDTITVPIEVLPDEIPPVTILGEHLPASLPYPAAPVITFSGSDNLDSPLTFECRLNGSAWTPCTSPVHLENLPSGRHIFEIRAIDNDGNVDPSPAVYDLFIYKDRLFLPWIRVD